MKMAVYIIPAASHLSFKTRREYIRVTLAIASLLSTVLKARWETAWVKQSVFFCPVNDFFQTVLGVYQACRVYRLPAAFDIISHRYAL